MPFGGVRVMRGRFVVIQLIVFRKNLCAFTTSDRKLASNGENCSATTIPMIGSLLKHAAQAAVLSLVFSCEAHATPQPVVIRRSCSVRESTGRVEDERKGTQNGARKRALLGPRWFR